MTFLNVVILEHQYLVEQFAQLHVQCLSVREVRNIVSFFQQGSFQRSHEADELTFKLLE